jgi:CBS domain containing-hemolysin-like protein
MSTETLLLTLLGFALVFLNGFFVAAEFAIVKLRRTQADELGRTHGLRGRVLRTVRTHLDAYLSACQLGITLASLGLGWIGEPAFARLLEPVLAFVGVDDPQVLHSIAFAVAFAFISFLHIVLGELAPKSVAIRRAEAVSLNTALPLYVFYWLMYPFIYVLNGAANVIVRRLGVELASEGDAVHSVDELRSVLRASHRHGELGSVETQILVHGLELGELTIGDLMRPLSELVWLSAGSSIGAVLAEVRSTRYTRYPVRDPESGRFTGLLHIKDLIAADERLRDIQDLQRYLRRMPYFDENASLLKVLKAFRTGDPHFGIVTDTLGTEIGFVTFEHVIEALFGPIEDEFAKKSPSWQRAGDGSVSGAGSLSLLSLEDAIGKPTPSVDVNSIGGLVQERLGRLPRQGERIRFAHFEVEVLQMAGPKIELVRVTPIEAPASTAGLDGFG